MKLEKKQVPIFVALCVVTVAMLGYAVYSLLGGASAKPAAAGTPVAAAPAAGTGQTPEAAAGLPPLPPTFRADPFRPTLVASAVRKDPKPASEREPSVNVAERAPLPPLPPLPEPEFAPAAWGPPAPMPVQRPAPAAVVTAVKPVPPPPAPAASRPTVTVAGIIEGENPVAILRLSDAQRQVVQVNDRVAEQYVVDEITENAVVLVSGKDRWRLFLED